MANGVHKKEIVTKGEEIAGFLSIIFDMLQPTQMNVWKGILKEVSIELIFKH